MSCLERIVGHVSSEEKASRAYRALANWCDENDWIGSAAFFRKESADEMTHAMAFEEYAIDRGKSVPVVLQPALPTMKNASLLAAFTAALELEKEVLSQLQAISVDAAKDGDYDVVRFLQTYLAIGVASIRALQTHVTWLTKAGSDMAALQAFDTKMAG